MLLDAFLNTFSGFSRRVLSCSPQKDCYQADVNNVFREDDSPTLRIERIGFSHIFRISPIFASSSFLHILVRFSSADHTLQGGNNGKVCLRLSVGQYRKDGEVRFESF